ncbi:MAG: GntR family transcriptional regulator [Clostridia bacterium]|nr:GntR family transcriptional regulator [Clostridia bacterium]
MDYRELMNAVGPRTGQTQEWVCRVLREGITSGKLQPGMQLKQDEVSAALSVSHIPVREALRQLEAQGLVTIHPNRGSVVTSLDRSALEDMMEIRASITYQLAKRAVPLMTQEDFAQMQELIEAQKQTADAFEEERLNYRFHEIITHRANNKVADMFIDLIHYNADRYLRGAFYADEARRTRSISEHQAILDACRAGDADKACTLLHDHILDARNCIPENMA